MYGAATLGYPVIGAAYEVVIGAAEYAGGAATMEYEGITVEVVASGMTGANSGSTTGSATGAGAGAATGAGLGAAFLVFLGFFLPIMASGPAKQQHSKAARRSHCQSSK